MTDKTHLLQSHLFIISSKTVFSQINLAYGQWWKEKYAVIATNAIRSLKLN